MAKFCQYKNIDLGKQDASGAAQTHVWVYNGHFEALQKETKTLGKFGWQQSILVACWGKGPLKWFIGIRVTIVPLEHLANFGYYKLDINYKYLNILLFWLHNLFPCNVTILLHCFQKNHSSSNLQLCKFNVNCNYV